MKRKALILGLAVVALATLLLAMGSYSATDVSADAGTMSWDLAMDDPAGDCPGAGTNDGDGLIETGECPWGQTNLWMQPEGGVGGTQGYFDGANSAWSTGPLGADATGDGITDPTDGLAQNRPATLGAEVGNISFMINSSLALGTVTSNNVDDVLGNADGTVTGQSPPCGNVSIDTVEMSDSFAMWNAITDDSNGTVSQFDDPGDPDDINESQELNGPNKEPDGVLMLPAPLPDIETTLGVTPGTAVSRAFGIARLEIVAGITNDVDVNFLVYKLHGLGGELGADAYLNLTVVQYPSAGSPDPNPGDYDPLAQTVVTCPPYWSSPVLIYGRTAATSDFDEDGTPDLTVDPVELVRAIIGTGGPYDWAIYASRDEDYDGDTIPEYADRCEMDPATGTAADDTDGDTMTGLCETTGAGNGEGTNPGPYVAAPPWAAGQDVDGDTYMNYVDNCPQVADRDLDADTVVDYQADTDGDTVGDVCELDIAPATTDEELVAGDGSGFAVPGGGTYVDNQSICNDRWSTGQAEPAGEAGDVFYKYCLAPRSMATTAPYINPALAHLRLSGYKDADNDARPDFWDGIGSACSNDATWCPNADPDPYDYYDPSDDDLDGHSDGCESYRGSDSLDQSSTPGAPSVADDCDGDTTSDVDELVAGTNPLDGIDSDGTGYCNDTEETSPPLNFADGTKWYEFYDVPVPARSDPLANGVRNGSVDITDVLAVLFYSGAAQNDGCGNNPNGNGVDYDCDKNLDGVPDGVDYDRSPGALPSPPNEAGPPNTAIDISDVLAALAQSGYLCPAKGVGP